MIEKGDHAVLALCMQEKIHEILTDDEGLGKIAISLGFRVTTSVDLLLEALKDRNIGYEGFEVGIKNLKRNFV